MKETNIQSAMRHSTPRNFLIGAFLLFSFGIALTQPPTLCERNQGFIPDVIIDGTAQIVYSSSLPSSFFTSQNVEIRGTLFVDNLTLFLFCKVRFAPGALIWVSNGIPGNLIAYQTEFFACEALWDGILAGGRVRLLFCEVEDMYNGIRVVDDIGEPTVSLQWNSFNRNHISVKSEGNPTFIIPFLLEQFYYNTFDCTSDLLPSWTPNLPAGSISLAGIHTVFSAGTIGRSGSRNIFRNLQHGIHATNSSLLIKGARFNDMIRLSAVGGTDGVGIHAIGGNIRVEGERDSNGNLFGDMQFNRNARAGIRTRGSNLHVEDAEFFHNAAGLIGTAISAQRNLAAQQIDILKNDFQILDAWGVVISRSTAVNGNHNNVALNDFALTTNAGPGNSQSCLQIHGPFGSTDNMFVNSNNFVTQGTGSNTAISFRNQSADNYLIDDNDITLNTTGKGFGIRLISNRGTGSRIFFNSFVGTIQNDNNTAVWFQNSPGFEICNNFTDETGTGYHFIGNCDIPGMFSQNNIDEHTIGLLIEDFDGAGIGMPGVIGLQERTLNTWLPGQFAYGQFAGQCLANPLRSLFLVQSTAPGVLPAQLDPANGWFVPVAGPLHACGGKIVNELTPFDAVIIDGLYTGGKPGDAAIWELNRQLMYKMKVNPGLQTKGGSYYANNSNSTFGRLAEADFQYHEAVQISASIEASLDSLRMIRNALLAQIAAIDSVMVMQDSVTFDTVNIAAKRALLNSIINVDEIEIQLQSNVEQAQKALITTGLAYTSTVSTSKQWEKNHQLITQYKYQLAFKNSLTVAEYDIIRGIASQCLAEGGMAVVDAVSLLPMDEWDDYDEPEKNLCNRSSRIENSPDSYLAKVFPNPASSEIRFEFDKSTSGSVQLWTLDGHLLTAREFQSQISLVVRLDSKYHGQTCVYKLLTSDGEQAIGKLVIAQ